MGVPHLNRTLRNNCTEGIKQINLSELEGKKIAIDASIYMYRYLADDNLLEGMFLMMSTLCDLGIIPILVFVRFFILFSQQFHECSNLVVRITSFI